MIEEDKVSLARKRAELTKEMVIETTLARQPTQEYRIIERFDEGCPEPFGFECIAVAPDVGCILMLHWLDGREAYQVKVEEVRGTTLHVRAVQ